MSTTSPPRTDRDSGDTEPRPLRGTVTLVVAAAFVALIVVGGVVALVQSRGDDDMAAEATAPPPPAVTTPRQSDRAGWGPPSLDPLGRRVETPPTPNGVALPQDPAQQPPQGNTAHCPAPAGDSAGTVFCTAPPSGVVWQRVDGVAMPFSSSDGPTAIDGELPTGFAPTPQGAALAAQQLMARSFASKDGALAVTTDRMVFDTLSLRRAQIDRITALPQWPPIPFDRIEAYTLTYWAPDYAVVEIASAPPEGGGVWTTGRIDLLWIDDDWWIKGGPQPGVSPGGTIMTLAGWTVWPAN